MNTPNFTQCLADIRAEEFDERERARIEALVATEAQVLASALCSEQRNLLIRREHTARDRRFSAEPVAITGFGSLDEQIAHKALCHMRQLEWDRMEAEEAATGATP